jgi:CelD/BcsL family acetyltransferase involved in cellulose biosynthesis
MTIYQLDPLTEPRWREFVHRHPQASAFHTPAWLGALERTYGYKPIAFTTSAPGSALQSGFVFCDIRSWLTGHRLVSLPFSDHCDPLGGSAEELGAICEYLQAERQARRWTHIELRPQTDASARVSQFAPSERYWLHQLDLRPNEDTLYRSFSRDSIQRKIERAEHQDLTYVEGQSDDLLRAFYRLLLMTRRRHRLPPQPFLWFRNLATCFGSAMKVRLATLGVRPVAAILTLSHRQTTVYKYGVSDPTFHRLGGVHLLFWRMIRDARACGHITLDLGRSDTDNVGLVTFKDRWGAARSVLTYCRYPAPQPSAGRMRRYAMKRARVLLDYVPDGCSAAAGRFLYRHAG